MMPFRAISIFSFWSLLWCVSVHAQGPSYPSGVQLGVTSSSTGDGSRILNCLTYQKCDAVQPRVGIDQNANATFIFAMNRSESEVLSQLKQCDLSLFKGKLFWQVGKTRKAFKLENAPSIALFPALYGKVDAEKAKIEFPKINELVNEGNTEKAVQAMVSALGLDTSGYHFEYKQEAIGHATMSGDTVTLPAQFKDACEIIQFLRHEYEHVQQARYYDQCHAENKKAVTSYEIIKQMEFAAHLGDVAAAEAFCPANTTRIVSVNHVYLMDYFDEQL